MKSMIDPKTTGKVLAAVISFVLLIIISTSVITRAATPAPSPSPDSKAESVDDLATENVKKRVIENAAAQIRGAIDSIVIGKKAVIGEVIRVTGETITIKNNNGQSIIPISKDTKLVRGNSEIKIDDIAVGSWATVMGAPEKEISFQPSYVLVSTTSLLPKQQLIVLGSIKEITRNSIIVQPRNNENEVEISIVAATDFQDSSGQEIRLADFEEDMAVLLTGFAAETENGKPVASTIRSLAQLSQEDE